MKKKLAMLCTILCSMSLIACGGKSDPSNTPTDSSSHPIGDSTGGDIGEKEIWTVTFDLNYEGGGTYKTLEVERSTMGVNIQSMMPEDPTRTGDYEFEGWYHDTYCKVEWVHMRDRIYADTTLYANWTFTGDEPIPVKKTTITWSQDESFTYQAVSPATLPTSVDEGTNISFKIVINDQYEGTPVVKAGTQVLTANQDVYSFVASGDKMTISVSGLTKKQQEVIDYKVTFNYTLPTWDPVASNPKVYYWGTDANGAHIENTIVWDSATDTQGAMTNVSGNDYSMTIELNEGDVITGVIVLMYQGGVKKQSQNLEVNITASGTYQIALADGEWIPNEFGEYCFPATITAL